MYEIVLPAMPGGGAVKKRGATRRASVAARIAHDSLSRFFVLPCFLSHGARTCDIRSKPGAQSSGARSFRSFADLVHLVHSRPHYLRASPTQFTVCLDGVGLPVLHEFFGTGLSFYSGAITFPIQFAARPAYVIVNHYRTSSPRPMPLE